jgi:hypothetical protein
MHAVTFGRRQSDVDKYGIELPGLLRHRLPARAAFMGWMSTRVVVYVPADTEGLPVLQYLKASSVALPSVLHAVAAAPREHSAAGRRRQPSREDSKTQQTSSSTPTACPSPSP